jgi:tetratricopeptide (TPR) repeat protein/two-component sensor histidine kinase
MLLTNLERTNLRELQQKIIDCYNNDGGDGAKVLIIEFVRHPANYSDEWIASNLANIAKKIKDSSVRLQMFEKVVNRDPGNIFYLTSYAGALVRANQLEKALPIFAKITQENPRDFKALTAYGNALIKSSDYTQSFTVLEQALAIEPNDTTTLTSYATALAKHGDMAQAFELFARSLELEPNNTTTLNSYARALAEHGDMAQAFEQFTRSLESEPNNTTTLNSYATALAKHGDIAQAFEQFARSLEHEPNDTTTLNSYATALAKHGDIAQAFEQFARSLELEPNNTITLTSYANALAEHGDMAQAFEQFVRSLELEPNNTTTLNSYANALAKHGDMAQAFEQFARSLALEPNNTTTLNSYAYSLIQNEEFPRAFEYLERAQQLDPNNTIIFSTYGVALVAYGEVHAALDKFEQALQLQPNNILTLTNYGKALVQIEKYEQALALFERVLTLSPNDNVALFLAANTLQILKRPKEAVEKLEKMAQSYARNDNFIRLNLGRLYFQLGREAEGRKQFDEMINNYSDADAARLRAAMSLMLSNPYSDDANRLLKGISEASSSYAQSRRMLSLNLGSKEHFDLFNKDVGVERQDQVQINRTLYHKIKNRIAVLKETLYDKLLDNESPFFRGLLEKVDLIFSGIKERRSEESEKTNKVNDYDEVMNIISATAHDIVDFVGNKISGIREGVLDYQADLPENDPNLPLCKDVLAYLKSTLETLNDLKSINEGVKSSNSYVKLQDVFETWVGISSLRHARINLYQDDPKKQLTIDIQKVRGFLDELVENSLKHNPNYSDFQIKLSGEVRVGLPLGHHGKVITIPGSKHYLHLGVSDNGKGIATDKKEWIFHPLTTTAPNNEGSGLGLFGIRRTLKNMRGFIIENGTQGANFDIYIPLENT